VSAVRIITGAIIPSTTVYVLDTFIDAGAAGLTTWTHVQCTVAILSHLQLQSFGANTSTTVGDWSKSAVSSTGRVHMWSCYELIWSDMSCLFVTDERADRLTGRVRWSKNWNKSELVCSVRTQCLMKRSNSYSSTSTAISAGLSTWTGHAIYKLSLSKKIDNTYTLQSRFFFPIKLDLLCIVIE